MCGAAPALLAGCPSALHSPSGRAALEVSESWLPDIEAELLPALVEIKMSRWSNWRGNLSLSLV